MSLKLHFQLCSPLHHHASMMEFRYFLMSSTYPPFKSMFWRTLSTLWCQKGHQIIVCKCVFQDINLPGKYFMHCQLHYLCNNFFSTLQIAPGVLSIHPKKCTLVTTFLLDLVGKTCWSLFTLNVVIIKQKLKCTFFNFLQPYDPIRFNQM